MDRFIADLKAPGAVKKAALKSNMDRFIAKRFNNMVSI